MDGRKALDPGTVLCFRNRNGGEVRYTLGTETGRGSSCIVYDASYEDNLGEYKTVRIKECYPHGLAISVGPDGSLRTGDADTAAFETAKQRMKDAYLRDHRLFSNGDLTNAVTNTFDIYECYGTVWIVSTWVNGRTLDRLRPASLKECLSLLLAAAEVLRNIHGAGYLYLDLKPENILVLHGVTDLIQLFDFDSTVSLDDLTCARREGDPSALRLSYTRGYAPLELQTGKLRQLGPWSDVYSLGAVLFSMLWGRVPNAFDCEEDCEFDFSRFLFAGTVFGDRLYRELSDFFHHTLAGCVRDRYRTMREAAEKLASLLPLSDEQTPCLYSTVIRTPEPFFGREKELAALERFLSSEEPVLSLSGMGGIGKSTLLRKYLASHRKRYDAVLYLFDRGSASAILTDDRAVAVNTVHRVKEETEEEYFRRKQEALRSLCSGQRVFTVIDQFDPAHWNALCPLFEIGWQVLLVSRQRLPDGLCPGMQIGEMGEADLAEMFFRYAHTEDPSDGDAEALSSLNAIIRGHTLTLELLARQIAKSRLTVRAAAELVRGEGLQALPPENIDFLQDGQPIRAPLSVILERLMIEEVSSEEDRSVMLRLALFDLPGIDAGLFRALTGIPDLNLLNELEAGGWVRAEGNRLSLHPLLQELVLKRPRTEEELRSIDRMAETLYGLIRPAGGRHDSDKQFSAEYQSLFELLRIADQLQSRCGLTPANQRLRYRILMDAPVDQDEVTLQGILRLLDAPDYLDDGSILRLFETSAFLFGRVERHEEALAQLKKMKAYLLLHPSAFYRSSYHRAMAIIIHNAAMEDHVKRCLRHQDQAIVCIRFSSHPDAKKQLAVCMTEKAATLLDAGLDMEQCERLLDEAGPLVTQYTEEYDLERYLYFCTGAMCRAMNEDKPQANEFLARAEAIASSASDSELSYIEHRLYQEVPIRMAMGETEKGIALAEQAIADCGRKADIAAYSRTRFTAWYTLAVKFEELGDYIRAEEMYAAMEAHRADSPWDPEDDTPFCPPEIKEKAEKQRKKIR